MLNIVIGLDYEIFFGENYKNANEVLFRPGRKLCDLFKKYDITSTFFADVCSVYQHRVCGLNGYVSDFTEQIRYMLICGQDVQLHIHPHWLRSRFNGSKWEFPSDHYRIHDFFQKEGSADLIISNGVRYLTEKLTAVDSNYRCVAYRAGGYCLQPYDKLIPILRSHGIMIDSSVAMYRKNSKDRGHYYDYTQLPKKLNYWISSDIALGKSPLKKTGESVFEVPIGFYRKNLLTRLEMGKGFGYDHGVQNGTPMSFVNRKENPISKLFRYNFEVMMISPDSMSAELMCKALNIMYRKYHCDKNDSYISVIAHPKSFTGKAFDNLERFIKYIIEDKEKYSFVNMRDVYQRII